MTYLTLRASKIFLWAFMTSCWIVKVSSWSYLSFEINNVILRCVVPKISMNLKSFHYFSLFDTLKTHSGTLLNRKIEAKSAKKGNIFFRCVVKKSFFIFCHKKWGFITFKRHTFRKNKFQSPSMRSSWYLGGGQTFRERGNFILMCFEKKGNTKKVSFFKGKR